MSRVYRYKLPASLGGAIVEGTPDPESQHVFFILDGHQVGLPEAMVIEIRPVQPEAGWVATDVKGESPQVFRRELDFKPDLWWHHDDGVFVTWDELCGHGEPTLLVSHATVKGIVGRCSECDETKPLRVDGRVRQHGSRDINRACKGSGRPPKEAS